MKLIDLFNKIANGEEVPKEIKIDGIEYKIVNPAYPYMYKDNSGNELEDNIHYITRFLDKEVEIIEEPKEIEKLEKRVISENYMIENKNAPEEEKWKLVRNLIYNNSKDTQFVKEKINELIDVVNELKKRDK